MSVSGNAAVCFILQFRLGHGADSLGGIGLVQDGALILGGRSARLACADQCEISFPALQ